MLDNGCKPMNTCVFLKLVKDCDDEKLMRIPTYLLSETR